MNWVLPVPLLLVADMTPGVPAVPIGLGAAPGGEVFASTLLFIAVVRLAWLARWLVEQCS